MKKQLFLTAMVVMAIASCSKDQTVSTNTGMAIDFRTSLATRATETKLTNLDKFYVTAIKGDANYFTSAEFVKDGTSSTFNSTPAYYWPGDNSVLSFFAYSPSAGDLGGTLTINSTTKKLEDFSPAADMGAQKDFITASATGTKSANEGSGVALTFDHRLAQIQVNAKNTNTGYVYKVIGVRIGQPVSKGTFDFATPGWTLSADKANYAVEYTTAKELNGTAVTMMDETKGNAMLIPQQLTAWASETDKPNTAKGAYLALKLQITTKDGARVYPAKGDYDWAAVAIGTNWEAGKRYIYTLDFSEGAGKVDPEKPTPVDPTDPFNPGDDILGKPIKFTVTVTDWVDVSPAVPEIKM